MGLTLWYIDGIHMSGRGHPWTPVSIVPALLRYYMQVYLSSDLQVFLRVHLQIWKQDEMQIWKQDEMQIWFANKIEIKVQIEVLLGCKKFFLRGFGRKNRLKAQKKDWRDSEKNWAKLPSKIWPRCEKKIHWTELKNRWIRFQKLPGKIGVDTGIFKWYNGWELGEKTWARPHN